MRVKWNRHLDGSGGGSSVRRCPAESPPDTGAAASDPKEASRRPSGGLLSGSPSPSFLRLFRSKKSIGLDDASTTRRDSQCPIEADDNEDCVSLSSVATVASQPGASVDYFPSRDRSVSLFSSFRINFSGGRSKKKARRIVAESPPAPLEEGGCLADGRNGSGNYSSPDLRKAMSRTSEVLSASSQSVRHEAADVQRVVRGVESAEVLRVPFDELRAGNAESLEKLKKRSESSNTETKLRKSVSFSDCKTPDRCKDSDSVSHRGRSDIETACHASNDDLKKCANSSTSAKVPPRLSSASEIERESRSDGNCLPRPAMPPRPPVRKKAVHCSVKNGVSSAEKKSLSKLACGRIPIRSAAGDGFGNDDNDPSRSYVDDIRYAPADLHSTFTIRHKTISAAESTSLCQSPLEDNDVHTGNVSSENGNFLKGFSSHVKLEQFPPLQKIKMHSNNPEIQCASISSSHSLPSATQIDDLLSQALISQSNNLSSDDSLFLTSNDTGNRNFKSGDSKIRMEEQLSTSTIPFRISKNIPHNFINPDSKHYHNSIGKDDKIENIFYNKLSIKNHTNDIFKKDFYFKPDYNESEMEAVPYLSDNSCVQNIPMTLPVTSHINADRKPFNDNVEMYTNTLDLNSQNHHTKNASNTFLLSDFDSSITFFERPSERGMSCCDEFIRISDSTTVPEESTVSGAYMSKKSISDSQKNYVINDVSYIHDFPDKSSELKEELFEHPASTKSNFCRIASKLNNSNGTNEIEPTVYPYEATFVIEDHRQNIKTGSDNVNFCYDADVKKMLDSCIEYATAIHNSSSTHVGESDPVCNAQVVDGIDRYHVEGSLQSGDTDIKTLHLPIGPGEREKDELEVENKSPEAFAEPMAEHEQLAVTDGGPCEQEDTARQPATTTRGVGSGGHQKGGRHHKRDIEDDDDDAVSSTASCPKVRSKIPVRSGGGHKETATRSAGAMPSKGISVSSVYGSGKNANCGLDDDSVGYGYRVAGQKVESLCLRDEIRYDYGEKPVICDPRVYLDNEGLVEGSLVPVIAETAFVPPSCGSYQALASDLNKTGWNEPDILRDNANVDCISTLCEEVTDRCIAVVVEESETSEVSSCAPNVLKHISCESDQSINNQDLSLIEQFVCKESGVEKEEEMLGNSVPCEQLCDSTSSGLMETNEMAISNDGIYFDGLCNNSLHEVVKLVSNGIETSSDLGTPVQDISFFSQPLFFTNKEQLENLANSEQVKNLANSEQVKNLANGMDLEIIKNDEELKAEISTCMHCDVPDSDVVTMNLGLNSEITEVDMLSKTLSESCLNHKVAESDQHKKDCGSNAFSNFSNKKSRKRMSRCKSEELLPSLEFTSIKHSRLSNNGGSLQNFSNHAKAARNEPMSYSSGKRLPLVKETIPCQSDDRCLTNVSESEEKICNDGSLENSVSNSCRSPPKKLDFPPLEATTTATRITNSVLDTCTSKQSSGLQDRVLSAEGQVRSDLQLKCPRLPADLDQTQCSSPRDAGNNNQPRCSASRQYANVGKSRIPKKHGATTRGAGVHHPSPRPARPAMWLSKAELSQEIQHLGNLCEARTKELNRLKMETKHITVGFDAFAALFKYMVEDLKALSVPKLVEDLEKTLKQLELTKQDLAYYEKEVEELKAHHCQELTQLSDKLFAAYKAEVAELNSKRDEEVNNIKTDHQKQVENMSTTFTLSSEDIKIQHEKLITSLEQELVKQREELQMFQESEIKDLEEKHEAGTKALQSHIEQLQKKYAELKQHSMSMEDAMQKDTDTKLQWVASCKMDLEKEVESLKAVLEMKNKELHTLRVQNLEMDKQLEELPLAREKIKMLQARAEDLEALMEAKTVHERKLSSENHYIRETYEKESKVNRRLSMENEELQWRLRKAEHSLISDSLHEVSDQLEEDDVTTPPPHSVSRSVFFTFVDKDDNNTPQSPGSQYKKINRTFSVNYKTSPKTTPFKSHSSTTSPRKTKSHSEPPPPPPDAMPRRLFKPPQAKTKLHQKRQRCESDQGPMQGTVAEPVFESMASSASSEGSVFEHKEGLLEEHEDQIMVSLDILREQRSVEEAMDETETPCDATDKGWGVVDEAIRDGSSQSGDFTDPKTYYHMTFAVPRDPGGPDCDTEGNSKESSNDSSPDRELLAGVKHSILEGEVPVVISEVSTNGTFFPKESEALYQSPVEGSRSECSRGVRACTSTPRIDSAVQQEHQEQNRWHTM